ncbi:MAG: hypothetical protein NVS3B14_15940 [Ktedonobacteraceae bacterium]
MSKQSANRNNKQRQGNGKSANDASSPRTQTPAKPAQTATKANATVMTKSPAQPETQVGTMASTKPAQASTKAGTPTATKQGSKQQRQSQKVQNRLAQQRIDSRNRRVTIFSIVAAFVLMTAVITYIVIQNNASANPLAQAQQVVDPTYQPIDGVYCDASEQSAYHIHALLTIYVNGQNVPLSTGIGIAPGSTPSCFYWIHTHDSTGVIHIESPTTRTYSLKQFFDIWASFASSSIAYPTQLSSSTGWTIYVNGKQVNTDFSHLQLTPHELITIAYNSPGIKPVSTYSWPTGL